MPLIIDCSIHDSTTFYKLYSILTCYFSDEQTMSMYLSCFVHKGVDEVKVDLFEGINESAPPIQFSQVYHLTISVYRYIY